MLGIMAVNIQARGASHQLRVTHKLLSRPFFHTFADRDAARAYGDQLQLVLDRGIVPHELLARAPTDGAGRRIDPLFIELARDFDRNGTPSVSDRELLGVVIKETEKLKVSHITFDWIERYVDALKRLERTPGTIRKRIGLMGRVYDRYMAQNPQTVSYNPFRKLANGYSLYSQDAAVVIRDVSRDRRLAPGEEAAIRSALRGEKHDGRQRAWVQGHDIEFELFFDLIVSTGLRLLEAYRLRAESLDVTRRIIHVDGSKGARGAPKPRIVPVTPALMARLQDWCGGRKGLVFSYWDGDTSRKAEKKTTGRLSRRFATLFAYAGCPDLTEHDLRHEATCRWVTLLSPNGGWSFSEIEIGKIMGWSDLKMMLRYASLRGEDWSNRLL